MDVDRRIRVIRQVHRVKLLFVFENQFEGDGKSMVVWREGSGTGERSAVI